jgi:hypothetical protein
MKKTLLLSCVFLISLSALALNYIGYTGEKIKNLVTGKETGFYFNKEFYNGRVNVLKYTDMVGDKTLLYVLDDNNICMYYLIMYDYSYLNKVEGKLDQEYQKKGDNTWIAKKDGKTYEKELKKQEWFFSVVTKEVKQ